MNVNTEGVKNAYEALAKNGLLDPTTDDNKVLVDANDYPTILDEMRDNNGEVSGKTKFSNERYRSFDVIPSVTRVDEVLNFKGTIFNKPGDKDNAKKQLQSLSGNTHELITSYAIITKDKQIVETVTSIMNMREISQEQISRYVELDNPIYSCGAYKLETMGIALFESIACPDHSAIIGLPLISLTTNLKKFGIDVL